MLKERIITALLLIPLVLFILFYAPPWLYLIALTFVYWLATVEWAHLIMLESKISRSLYRLGMLLLLIPTSLMIEPIHATSWQLVREFGFMDYFSLLMQRIWIPFLLHGAAVWWLIAGALVVSYPYSRVMWGRQLLLIMMSIFMLLPFWAAMVLIRFGDLGTFLLTFLFFIVWSCDAAGYFVGRKWGKHSLIPAVSPNKTWEGAIGGVAIAFLIGFIVAEIYFLLHGDAMPSLHIWSRIFVLIGVTAIAGIIGDLFESMIKRHSGVKDTGALLPGHGGILDRIDALTAAAPLFALTLLIQSAS